MHNALLIRGKKIVAIINHNKHLLDPLPTAPAAVEQLRLALTAFHQPTPNLVAAAVHLVVVLMGQHLATIGRQALHLLRLIAL